jgi:hypothetical protein
MPEKLNLNLNVSYNQPDIHSLARLDADLFLALSYCDQCQRNYNGSGMLARLLGNTGHMNSKNGAIEHAGMAMRDARNLEINSPASDSMFSAYALFRPIALSISSKIGPYKDEAKLRELLEQPINDSIESRRERLEELKKAPEERFYRGGREREILSIEEEIKSLEEGKKTALFTTLFSEASSDLVSYIMTEGLAYLNNSMEGLKREDVIKFLKYDRDIILRPSSYNFREPAQEFVAYCSGTSKPVDQCSEHRRKLDAAYQELMKQLGERKETVKEMGAGIEYVFNTAIAAFSIMNDEEFGEIKNRIIKLWK